MPSHEEIWAALLRESPMHNMDDEYLLEQARILGLDQERMRRLWRVCEEHPESVLSLFEAYEVGVITQPQVEQVLAGTWPIERVKLFLTEYRRSVADELEAQAV